MKRIIPFIALLIAAAAIGSFRAISVEPAMPYDQKLRWAERAISEFYVDTVDEEKLVETAINAMLEKLDPHSRYTNAEETRQMTEPLQGNFSGVGIQFNMQKDTLYVIQTVAGGPSEKAGILAGDRIIAVNDTSIAGVKMRNTDIMKRIRGPKGTKVKLQVIRRQVAEPIDFVITRDDIPINSLDAAYMADATTGYIRLSRFGSSTDKEMSEAVAKLRKQGMKQLILDLCDNGGGYLETAIEVCNHFLERGDLIVYTEGLSVPRQDSRANGWGDLKDIDLVVMVNQYSASASEIVSGALQDHDRAVVVGRRTFGKGLVQRPFPFPDGSLIRLTVARYYTPAGRCIQKPYDDYEHELLNRYKHGEFYSADSIHFADSLKVYTLRNRRVIYGGGGVMPDVFVPFDTTQYTDFYRDLTARGTLHQNAVAYVDAHRKEIKATYPTSDDFIERFTVTDDILDNLLAEAQRDSIKFDSAQYELSRELIADVFKAIVARDIYADSDYFRVVNRRNPMLVEALAIINDKRRYNSILQGNDTAGR